LELEVALVGERGGFGLLVGDGDGLPLLLSLGDDETVVVADAVAALLEEEVREIEDALEDDLPVDDAGSGRAILLEVVAP
jgi:hypothetical protein